MEKIRKKEALNFHSEGRPGKIEVVPTKSTNSQRDLSLAYSPGVAEPCLKIAANTDDIYKYTAKGNLVAVISNGSAVLGLGDIGPEASKPVMEGKGLLFKIYADIDVFDIEVDATDVDAFVATVKAISPTFGGINLEDIKAPECFEIERRLKEELNIPIMHDDQHGTAIISGAALLNALEIIEKDIEKVQVVFNGAGAAAISCAKLYVSLGVRPENIVMCDSRGVIRADRQNLTGIKKEFSTHRDLNNLADALFNANVFVGLSKGNVMSVDMLKKMADQPIVFAMANPVPEISYAKAMAARKDIIFATGRSDYPNQVNNVLGFPYIFRGALDVRATQINEEMKIAAVKAIAELTKELVPEDVNITYGDTNITFGPDYIIPKPNDPRLISKVAPAVAKAAIESGVSKIKIDDWEAYKVSLMKRIGRDNKFLRNVTTRAKRNPKRIVFSEADHYNVLKAAQIIKDEMIGIPVLLGRIDKIQMLIRENGFDFDGVEIIDPKLDEMVEKINLYGDVLWEKRSRDGYTQYEARRKMRERNYFGAMMVELGDADAMISGFSRNYPETIRPALQIVGTAKGISKVAGLFVIMTSNGPMFFADTTININPNADELADIAELTADAVLRMGIKPILALLSYSNFGSTNDAHSKKVKQATDILHRRRPDLIVDGEVQANFAVNKDSLSEKFPFSRLKHNQVNVVIFPNLESGNISYKLLQELAGFETIGPILIGLKKTIHILQLGASVKEIINMSTLAVADAHTKNVKK
ncbi:MAG: NADP-dependent malic enzyme [Flavobacteriales bacterium]|nr:NADP-dependent malic enzyme [Flavobacteriales bacterium]|tara:strand:- start:5533 stop:7809 length:2277 start_codon:yes stop_codon:yes gene_type:complete